MKFFDLNQWRHYFNNPTVVWAGLVASSGLLLLSLWGAVDTFWLASKPLSPIEFHTPRVVNSANLPNLHLFGANTTNLNDLPLASLGVTLLGIFIDGQGHSSALIGMASNNQTYHVGDSLAPNVIIEKILPTSVVVLHNGKLEKLELPIQPIALGNTLPLSGLWKKS